MVVTVQEGIRMTNGSMTSYGSIERSPDPITTSPTATSRRTRNILLLAAAALVGGFFLFDQLRFGGTNNITSSLYAQSTMNMVSDVNLGLSLEGHFHGVMHGKNHHSNGKQTKKRHHSPNDCDSPFGYGLHERQRLVACFGKGNILVASYDSNVNFAHQLLATVAEITGDNGYLSKHFLFQGFQFFMQAESGICKNNVPAPLCRLLECGATNPAPVGTFIKEAVTYPDRLAVHPLSMLSQECGEQYKGNCLDRKRGGSGSGSGMQLYCTTHNESTALLTVGGGGGGGAGPGVSWGSGGGAGMQILLEQVNKTTACTVGGRGNGEYGRGGDDTCPMRRKLREKNRKGKRGRAHTVRDDEGCETSEFVSGIDLVKAAVAACIKNPNSELSVSAGGGSGGGARDYERLLYRFGSGFSFSVGPTPIDSRPNDTGGNTTDSDLKAQCSYAYADAVCKNAGYLEQFNTSYALCLCPVQQMYNPPSYGYNCSYSSSDLPTSDEAVSVDILGQNCETWCPEEEAVTMYSGEACPVLLPACSCKVPNESVTTSTVAPTTSPPTAAPALTPTTPPPTVTPTRNPITPAPTAPSTAATLSTTPPTFAPVTPKRTPRSRPPTTPPTVVPLSPPPTTPPTLMPITPPPMQMPTRTPKAPPPTTPPTVAPLSPPPTTPPTRMPITPTRTPITPPTVAPISPPPTKIPTLMPITPPPTQMPTHTPITPPPTVPPTVATRMPVTSPPTKSPNIPPASPHPKATHTPASVTRPSRTPPDAVDR